MRIGRKAEVVARKSKVVAVNLGSDLCAEHEWGIKLLRRYFDCKDDECGVASRLTHTVPAALTWFNGEGFQGIFLPTWRDQKPPTPMKGTVTWGAWDEGSFGIFSGDPKIIKQLLVIYEAIKSNDAVIWLGGGGVFDNAGLCIGVASNLPTEVKQAWKKADEDRNALRKAAEETGIADRIKAAGLKYFALSPRLATDGTVQFWLNPMQQDIYNSMLCTVADLDAWIQGKGPVVKTKKQQRRRW
jgi:hypothetical protein